MTLYQAASRVWNADCTLDVTGRPSVSLWRGLTRLRCAHAAELIEVLFRVETSVDRRNIVLDGGPRPPRREEVFGAANLATCTMSNFLFINK